MNRVRNYLRLGSRAQRDIRSGQWQMSFAVMGLARQGQSDQRIAEQFDVSDDTIRNTRRAYQLFLDFLKQGYPYSQEAKKMRRHLDKSKWECAARYYDKHHSLADAFEDLYRHEGSVDDHEATLYEKYNGDPLRRDLARIQNQLEIANQDVWARVDKGVLPKRIGSGFREAKVRLVEQLEAARDALRKDAK